MKRNMLTFAAGALFMAASCTSTDTSSDTATTAETATATDATVGTEAGTTVTATDEVTVTDMNDATFVVTAASSNMLEIELGRLAVQHAQDADVKQYGQMMIDHHTAANQELQGIAKELNVEMPSVLTAAHQSMLDKMQGKTGKEFDEDFMDLMETSHKMTITMFEAKANDAQHASLKAYAVKTLPVLRAHLEKATALEDTVD